MPTMPMREKGARLDRFLTRHRGRRTRDVMPKSEDVREAAMPPDARRSLNVSARIMLSILQNTGVIYQITYSLETNLSKGFNFRWG